MSKIHKVIDIAGGQSTLAKRISEWHERHGSARRVKQQHVWKWARTRKAPVPPAEDCLAIAEITGLSVHFLRPDVYGPETVS